MLSLPDNKDWLEIVVINGYTEFVILVCIFPETFNTNYMSLILPTYLNTYFEVAYRSVMLAENIISLSANYLEL